MLRRSSCNCFSAASVSASSSSIYSTSWSILRCTSSISSRSRLSLGCYEYGLSWSVYSTGSSPEATPSNEGNCGLVMHTGEPRRRLMWFPCWVLHKLLFLPSLIRSLTWRGSGARTHGVLGSVVVSVYGRQRAPASSIRTVVGVDDALQDSPCGA